MKLTRHDACNHFRSPAGSPEVFQTYPWVCRPNVSPAMDNPEWADQDHPISPVPAVFAVNRDMLQRKPEMGKKKKKTLQGLAGNASGGEAMSQIMDAAVLMGDRTRIQQSPAILVRRTTNHSLSPLRLV